jgi:hypothetical protein
MTISVLCESPRDAILRRSVPRSVFAVRLLSAFIYFLAQMDLRLEISRVRFEI